MQKPFSLFKLTSLVALVLLVLTLIILPLISRTSAVAGPGVCFRCAMFGSWVGCALAYQGQKSCKMEQVFGGWRCASFGGSCNVGGPGGSGDGEPEY